MSDLIISHFLSKEVLQKITTYSCFIYYTISFHPFHKKIDFFFTQLNSLKFNPPANIRPLFRTPNYHFSIQIHSSITNVFRRKTAFPTRNQTTQQKFFETENRTWFPKICFNFLCSSLAASTIPPFCCVWKRINVFSFSKQLSINLSG